MIARSVGDRFELTQHDRPSPTGPQRLPQPSFSADFFAVLVVAVASLPAVSVPCDGRPFEDPGTAAAAKAAELIRIGDVDGGLRYFIDFAGGAGAWDATPQARRALRRSNAWTLVGQAREHRPQLSCADLKPLKMPILLFGGDRGTARLKGVLDAIQACLPTSERVTISGAGHSMSATHPEIFNTALRAFLDKHLA
ncbi:MAG: alpha/beta hydrolase [Burkholderiaceae bacterium]|nr:alpha/beta hydrolase [Burkholderiaceae bacterium]